MPSRRLHVTKILSIGAVAEPDNEESRILLFKSRDGEPPAKQKQNPAMRVSKGTQYQAWIADQDKQLAELRVSSAQIQATIDEIREDREAYTMAQQETAEDVIGRIDAAADVIMSEQGLTKAEAKAQAWRDNPDLVAKSRSAPKVTAETVATISDRVREVIDDATRTASWRPLMERWGDGQTRDQIIAKVRVEVWHTQEGQTLRDLDRAKGSEPYTKANVTKIAKAKDGDRFTKALGLLDSGIQT